ncbi:MAG: hypothetical protein IJH79_04750, partial [Lentisphaeria bacterium]|nr:hypothetical protein [Lentisphaeria bacterium]
DRSRMYLQKAGTIILAATIILYLCNTLPEKKNFSRDYDAEAAKVEKSLVLNDSQIKTLAAAKIFDAETMTEIRKNHKIPANKLEEIKTDKLAPAPKLLIETAAAGKEQLRKLENEKSAEKMEYTISGRVGHLMEPVFRHIGFDWKLSTASIGALAAKEVFVSQLGTLYAEGEADEESTPLREHLRSNYTPLQGFCIMLFCLLTIPCLATLAIIRRELNSTRMAFIEAAALLILAYLMTFIVFQVGTLLQIGTKLL